MENEVSLQKTEWNALYILRCKALVSRKYRSLLVWPISESDKSYHAVIVLEVFVAKKDVCKWCSIKTEDVCLHQSEHTPVQTVLTKKFGRHLNSFKRSLAAMQYTCNTSPLSNFMICAMRWKLYVYKGMFLIPMEGVVSYGRYFETKLRIRC